MYVVYLIGTAPYEHLSADEVKAFVVRGGKLVQPERCSLEMYVYIALNKIRSKNWIAAMVTAFQTT